MTGLFVREKEDVVAAVEASSSVPVNQSFCSFPGERKAATPAVEESTEESSNSTVGGDIRFIDVLLRCFLDNAGLVIVDRFILSPFEVEMEVESVGSWVRLLASLRIAIPVTCSDRTPSWLNEVCATGRRPPVKLLLRGGNDGESFADEGTCNFGWPVE